VKAAAPNIESFIPRIGSVLAAMLSLVMLFGSATARADAVEPPPENCPAGTYPTSGHCGPHCIADTCSQDSVCDEGGSCVERSLCVFQFQGPCGNHLPDAATTVHDAVAAACGSGGTCSKGKCQTLDVCAVPEPPPSPITIDSGCGCELVGHTGGSGQIWLLVAAFVGLAIGSRRLA